MKNQKSNPIPNHLKPFVKFLDHLNKESERGQALICASFIDDLLLKVISAFLLPGKSQERLLVGFNAPLGTFSARIETARALGLVSETEHHDASIIRKIRNEFAHTHSISFDDPGLRKRCAELKLSAKDYDDVVLSPRSQFGTAATALILNLTNRPHYVEQRRLTEQQWRH